jgi:glycosyltransferase involved in cell wall biosynthesis
LHEILLVKLHDSGCIVWSRFRGLGAIVAPRVTRLWDPGYRQTNPMKLSIALATCNGQRFLRDQLDSFLSQTRRPDELVVCDDRSEDQTLEILTEFRASASFPVRILQNEHRLGITKNFEQVVGRCDGDVIFLSDQDDSWASEKLTRHEAVYLTHPDVGLVFSNGEVVDEALAPLGYTLYDAFHVHPRRQRAMCTPGIIDPIPSPPKSGCAGSA